MNSNKDTVNILSNQPRTELTSVHTICLNPRKSINPSSEPLYLQQPSQHGTMWESKYYNFGVIRIEGDKVKVYYDRTNYATVSVGQPVTHAAWAGG